LKHKKPYVVIRLDNPDEESGARRLKGLLEDPSIKILNVAGARGSRKPDVGKVDRILEKAFFP
jgi:hypothetical protein